MARTEPADPAPTDPNLVGEYIIEHMRQWRKIRGLSQVALDREIRKREDDWKMGTTQNLERRLVTATPRRLAQMANAFRIPIAVLLEKTEHVHRTPPGGRRKKDTKR